METEGKGKEEDLEMWNKTRIKSGINREGVLNAGMLSTLTKGC